MELNCLSGKKAGNCMQWDGSYFGSQFNERRSQDGTELSIGQESGLLKYDHFVICLKAFLVDGRKVSKVLEKHFEQRLLYVKIRIVIDPVGFNWHCEIRDNIAAGFHADLHTAYVLVQLWDICNSVVNFWTNLKDAVRHFYYASC